VEKVRSEKLENKLDNIINDFHPEKFINFFRDRNNKFRQTIENVSYLDDDSFFNSRKLGEIPFDEVTKLVIYAFQVKNPLSERSGKKKQYDKGKKILKDEQVDAGIFIFYDEKGSFRFSLIYAEYFGAKRTFNHFKRFTYFVSKDQTNKTFKKQIGEGNFSTLEAIKEAFSVEKVTKEFYSEIANWYFWAMDKVSFPEDYKYNENFEKDKEIRNATNLIRLITRIIFIWFIKQKNLIPDKLFDKTYLKEIVKDFGKSTNYYNAILQNLFFATLNQKISDRAFANEGNFLENRTHFGIKTLYRYKELFKINEDEVLNLFKEVPFLNGGLFDCLDKDNIYIDGFSRNPEKRAKIEDSLFFKEEQETVDLSKYGMGKNKPIRGLIEILKTYNFTIDESTPIDQEVALDPELLGRIFENLLASFNPETSTTARKATGSYYTPREIVEYMVDESLKGYLNNSLSLKGFQPQVDGVVNEDDENSASPFVGDQGSSFPSCRGDKGVFLKWYQLPYNPSLKEKARELRKAGNLSEVLLWDQIKNKQFLGLDFDRQKIIGNYIVDFYCKDLGLVIEIDGISHNDKVEYDLERDTYLKNLGLTVIHISDLDVKNNLEGVMEFLKSEINKHPVPSGHPSTRGELTPPIEHSFTRGENIAAPSKREGVDKITMLLSYSDEIPELTEEEKKSIVKSISELKILDPACGSGAFPMGILHKLLLILQKIDPENKYWYKLQREKALQELDDVLNNEDSKERAELLSEINDAFDTKINHPDYARKLFLIENCIYGVDIQPIAIQISKLRFFISLIIDQNFDKQKDNFGIRPLPNLETKFVCANTLIGLNRPDGVLISAGVIKLEEDIKNLRHRYFQAKTRTQKLNLQKKDKELRDKLANELKKCGFSTEASQKIAQFDPYDQNASANWFDAEWMFGVKDGFDIVIGNPPYIQLQKDGGKLAKLYENQKYQTFARTGDIYTLFYEKGLQLLKLGGLLCYITSNKWMRAGYGEKLREFFTKHNPLLLIDLGPGVFENATVDTNILLIQKAQNKNYLKALTLQKIEEKSIAEQVQQNSVLLEKLNHDAWFIGSSAEQRLKEKIERIGNPLKDWDVKIYRGVLTGLNEAFIITTEKRNEILAHCKDEAERQRTEALIKPILRGRDIKRYHHQWAGLWVVGTFPALKLDIEQYPAIKKYFLDNFDIRQLEQSGKKYPELGFDARKKTGNKWFETQDQIAYYSEFEKEKVIYPNMTKFLPFIYDNNNFYTNQKCFILTSQLASLKYLTGYFNSKISHNWLRNNCPELQGGTRELSYIFFQNLPIPPITSENQPIVSQIEALVEKILAAKKQDPNTDTSHWEQEIDELVYRLYDLTMDEIKIIEGK